MSPSPLRPAYTAKPIGSLRSLATALGVTPIELESLCSSADSLYRLAKPIVKPDGSIRRPVDALPQLKRAHLKIKQSIFSHLVLPPYLTGSRTGMDYKTNASYHKGKKILICEDIQNFFPTVKRPLVRDVWLHVFNFPPAVADALAALTTKDGALPQGAITSSYLANLVLYRWEPAVVAAMEGREVTYSRYVDDVAMSSRTFLTSEQKERCIKELYAMLAKAGLKAKRKKHEIHTSGNRMIATKLLVNRKPGLTTKQRSAIRAAVFEVERLFREQAAHEVVASKLSAVTGRVGVLSRFHPAESKLLATRLKEVREKLNEQPFRTGPATSVQSGTGSGF